MSGRLPIVLRFVGESKQQFGTCCWAPVSRFIDNPCFEPKSIIIPSSRFTIFGDQNTNIMDMISRACLVFLRNSIVEPKPLIMINHPCRKLRPQMGIPKCPELAPNSAFSKRFFRAPFLCFRIYFRFSTTTPVQHSSTCMAFFDFR